MRGHPGCLLQSARGEVNRILLASALSSMCAMCPNRLSRRDWIIAMTLGCFISVHHRSKQIGTIWCQAAYADTTGRMHWSYMHPSLISPSSPNHTAIWVRCMCCTLQLRWGSKPWSPYLIFWARHGRTSDGSRDSDRMSRSSLTRKQRSLWLKMWSDLQSDMNASQPAAVYQQVGQHRHHSRDL